MKKLALYATAILIVAGLVISHLATPQFSPETNRQMAIINDTKGSSDQRGVGAPLIKEFENQIN
jgi:hypothetical protein